MTMTWAETVRLLKKADEKLCWKMLKEEREGANRPMFLLRIYGKANRLRTERERKELLG